MSNNKTQKQATKAKIIKFIDAVSGENYAAANKYLQSAIKDKLETRFRQATEHPLF
jgi:hypothetical protein